VARSPRWGRLTLALRTASVGKGSVAIKQRSFRWQAGSNSKIKGAVRRWLAIKVAYSVESELRWRVTVGNVVLADVASK
jgi:hypothetical protein